LFLFNQEVVTQYSKKKLYAWYFGFFFSSPGCFP
jgi:hypothetical protein